MLKTFLIMLVFSSCITFPAPIAFFYKMIVSRKDKEEKTWWARRLLLYFLLLPLFTLFLTFFVYVRDTCHGSCDFGSYCDDNARKCLPSK